MKFIQVFPKDGEGHAEIDAQLLKLTYLDSGVWVKTKEDNSIYSHFFPYVALSMLRIWEEK